MFTTIVVIRVEGGDVDAAVRAAEKAVVLTMPPKTDAAGDNKPKRVAAETHWYSGA